MAEASATSAVIQGLLDSCATGKLDQLESFLERARNVDPKATPPPQYLLEVAAKNGQAEIINYLFTSLSECHKEEPWNPSLPKNIEYHDIPEKWRFYEDEVVHKALEGAHPIRVFKVFFEHGMSPDFGMGNFGSLLSNAMSSFELAKFLLEKGADPNTSNCGKPSSKSCLLLAAHNPTTEILNLLLQHGAHLQGSEALRGAAEARQICNAQRLLELGADINEVFTKEDYRQPNPPYRSPCGYALHFAVKGSELNFTEGNSAVEMVRFLLENGARMDVLDDDGNTPVEVAKAADKSEIVTVFEEHEAKVT